MYICAMVSLCTAWQWYIHVHVCCDVRCVCLVMASDVNVKCVTVRCGTV